LADISASSANKVSTEPDFSLLEWKFTAKQGEEARMSHMVMN
jgi:hypothetical protein